MSMLLATELPSAAAVADTVPAIAVLPIAVATALRTVAAANASGTAAEAPQGREGRLVMPRHESIQQLAIIQPRHGPLLVMLIQINLDVSGPALLSHVLGVR